MDDTQNSPDPSGNFHKLWYFSQALQDAQQRQEIYPCLSSRDWSFLNDILSHPQKAEGELHPPGHSSENNYPFYGRPTLQTLKHRNYMVLTVEDDNDNTGQIPKHQDMSCARKELGIVELPE